MAGTTGAGEGSYAQQYADQIKFAVIIVSTVPVLCIYPFIQKYFEKGVMIGAVKGWAHIINVAWKEAEPDK